MRRYDQLDGLRAIAVSGVVICHALPPTSIFAPLGGMGVRLFFVLSGFLITGILLRERDAATAAHDSCVGIWRAFYLRRALRIFPVAYAAIALAALIGIPEAREHPWWYLTYTSNIRSVLLGQNAAAIGHFWSLAVEEQFYLFWPFLILWAPRRHLVGLVTALIVLAGLSRGLVAAQGHDLAAYVLTPLRLDALAAGSVLAVCAVDGITVTPRALVGLGLACFGFAAVPSVFLHALSSEWGHIALCSAFVLAAVDGFRGPLGWALLLRPVVYLGTISYGIYVVHYFVPESIALIEQRFNIWLRFPPFGVWRLLYLSTVSVAAAALSWRVMEAPINALKRYVPYAPTRPRRSAVASGIAGPAPTARRASPADRRRPA
jgi:peptidoglycan/LPS O-acetylase OafA/YrhL